MKKQAVITALIFSILCSFPGRVSGQDKDRMVTAEIKGYLMDESGLPLSGAYLKAGKSKMSTFSDPSGIFELQTGLVDHISLEAVGFKSRSIQVIAGKLEMDTIIVRRTNILSEKDMVDIPFGKIESDRSTGSVVKISGEQIRNHPSGQVTEALTGLFPGLMVRQSSSLPGLEGCNLTYHGHSVMVLIDGLPQIVEVGLREIDEVVFMRGASATAMMGDLGANGLLLIKTKRGKTGPRKMEIEYEFGRSSASVIGEYLNSYNYASLINQSLNNDELPSIYSNEALTAYQDGSDPLKYPDVNYSDQFLVQNMSRHQFNTQLSGGTKNSRYFANFSYTGQGGIEKTGEQISSDDLVFRSNLDVDIARNTVLDVGLVGSFQQQRLPKLSSSEMFGIISEYPPNAFPLRFNDTVFLNSKDWDDNLLFEMNQGGYREVTGRRIMVNTGLRGSLERLLKGLSFQARVSLDIWNEVTLQMSHTPDLYELLYDTGIDGSDSTILNKTSSGNVQIKPSTADNGVYRRYNYFGALNYSNTFNTLHGVAADLVMYQYNFENQGRLENDLGQMINFRGNYSYNKKYAVEAILAYNGSNKLYEGNRYKLFPTIGLSWVASNEKFLLKSRSINYLKVRGSYGQQGYLRTDNYYSFWDRWSTASDVTFGTRDLSYSVDTYTKEQTGNPDIKWPVKSTINLGADALMMNRSLAIQLDYFYSSTKGMLRRYEIPMVAGEPGFYASYNLEDVSGNGVELGLTYSKSFGEFYLAAGINGGYFIEKYTKIEEPSYPDTYSNLQRENDPSDAIYGLDDMGLFTADEAASNTNHILGMIFEDDIRYTDYNGDGAVDGNDDHMIGNSTPRIIYGINITARYKSFSLYLNAAGLAGYHANLGENSYGYQASGYGSRPAYLNNPLPNGNPMPRYTVLGSGNNYRNSTYWLVKGGYFGLENIELAYHLPARITAGSLLRGTKIYLRGRNLFYLSSFKDINPEMPEGGYSDYPIFRELSAGITLMF